MIINSLLEATQKSTNTVRFDGRFTTPVRLWRKAARPEDGETVGYLELFLDRESINTNRAVVASISVTVSAHRNQPTPSPTTAVSVVNGARRSVFSNVIQSLPAQTFNSASVQAANSLMNVKLSADVLSARLSEATVQYVLPAGNTMPKDKSAFYHCIFVNRSDPGSVGEYEVIDQLVTDTSMIRLSEAGIPAFDSLPEWVFVTISSYDGKGIYLGSSSVRVNTKVLATEHDLATLRSFPQPLIGAARDITASSGDVVVTVHQSPDATRLFGIDLAPGSLLQDDGNTTSTFLGFAPPAGARVTLQSSHLAQSPGNMAIYRAVDALGRFTGTLVGGMLDTSCFQASISLSRTADGVLVELLNVPANVSFVKVYRRSFQVDDQAMNTVGEPDTLVFSQPTTGVPVDTSFVDILDQAISVVARPTYYTYYAECIDSAGNVATTRESTILVEPSFVALGLAKPVVSGLQTAYNSQTSRSSLTFQLSFDVTQDTVTTELVRILSAQGLIQYYADQIDPNQLVQMMTAKVTLLNMVSGEEVGLGAYGQGSTITANDLVPGYYRLELVTTARKAETAIDTYVATGKSTPRPGTGNTVTYQYMPAMFLNPASILDGTLAPSSSAQPNVIYQTFTGNSALVGYFVDATYIPVDLFTASKPSIVQKQTTAVAVSPVLERISWQVDKSDTTNAISHFLVHRDGRLRGIVAGSVSNNTGYVFYDTPTVAGKAGQYKVVGYLFDGTVMAGSDS